MTEELIVEKDVKPKRLDLFLKEILPFSRKRIVLLVKEGNILVNNKKVKPSYILKGGERIFLDIPEEVKKELIPCALNPEPEIIFEDENYLIINKPAKVIVHPNLKNLNLPTISSWLIYRWPSLKGVGEDPLRPGIVHRLDKETSGILLIAKNNSAFYHLKKQFQERLVEKEYIALIYGKILKDEEVIDLPLAYSKKSFFRRKVVLENKKSQKIKKAITYYQVLKRYKNYTLLKIKPLTGRTHQIRVHLASIGFPIVGDKVYGKKLEIENKKRKKIVSRLFLHAQRIKFFGLNGEVYDFSAPLPLDLKEILSELEIE